MLSNQELLSYIRNSYNEYKNNEAEFDNDIDSIIERRCKNAGENVKRQFNGIHANSL